MDLNKLTSNQDCSICKYHPGCDPHRADSTCRRFVDNLYRNGVTSGRKARPGDQLNTRFF